MKSNLESSPVEASACPPDAPDPQSDALVRQFRAYLHQVISAEPTRPGKPSTALPGPTILSYARALAGLPDHPLARELSRPLVAILDQMTRLADFYEGMLLRTDAPSAAWRAAARQVLDQVDFAHAQVLHTQLHPLRRRGRVTANLEFLGCAIELAIGQGADAARLIRRYQKLNPEPPARPTVRPPRAVCRRSSPGMPAGAWPPSKVWATTFPANSATPRAKCPPGPCSCPAPAAPAASF